MQNLSSAAVVTGALRVDIIQSVHTNTSALVQSKQLHFVQKKVLPCLYWYLIYCKNVVLICTPLSNNIAKYILSHDVAPGSDITPCNIIDKPLVVYRFSGNVVTSIITLCKIREKFDVFTLKMQLLKIL